MLRRAKIGGTLGPACDTPEILARMIEAGLDVARLNFSHGETDDHRRRVSLLERAAAQAGKRVTVLADLQGPRFRVGALSGGALELVDGDAVQIVAGKRFAPPGRIPVSYAALVEDVERGHPILMDDGKIALRVERIRRDVIHCVVERGGVLTDRKGVNLPDSELSVPALTSKDRRDLKAAVGLGADWLAISFVHRADDIHAARRLLKRAGSQIPILAKIERAGAIDRIEEILEASDGILVARGDLGVEVPPARVPILQKELVELANAVGKPVMTATQMLESMRSCARPTRAEASDVANAVLDGSDILLLTAETAAGKFPVEAIEMMHGIIERAEASGRTLSGAAPRGDLSVALTTCRAACRAAYDASAKLLVVFTTSGSSAIQAARFRPRTPILAFTPDSRVARRLNMIWGVEPLTVQAFPTVEQQLEALDRALLKEGRAVGGDLIVAVTGSPMGVAGTTNLMKVHTVGSALRRGRGRTPRLPAG